MKQREIPQKVRKEMERLAEIVLQGLQNGKYNSLPRNILFENSHAQEEHEKENVLEKTL